MKYKVWHDKDNDVIRFSQNESLNADDIREVTPQIEKLARDTGLKHIIIDLSKGATATLDKGARQALKEFAMPDMFDKIAIFGANPAMKMIAKVIFTITRSSESTNFFKTEDDALAWLKE
ncbi:hypothetical protein GF338_03150 [candidate division WOR-3 bacterium]|nr:hypothetical protein [candidate division WOR-3 bacterium]